MASNRCQRIGCSRRALYNPVLLVRAEPDEEPARGRCSLKLCEDCSKDATPETLVSDVGWREIRAQFVRHNWRAPERHLIEVEIVPIIGKGYGKNRKVVLEFPEVVS